MLDKRGTYKSYWLTNLHTLNYAEVGLLTFHRLHISYTVSVKLVDLWLLSVDFET